MMKGNMVSLLVFGRKNGLSKMMYKGWENEKVSVIYKTGYNQQGVVSYGYGLPTNLFGMPKFYCRNGGLNIRQ